MSIDRAMGEMTVNGDPAPVPEPATIGGLLDALGIKPGRVVVELNGTIYRRGEGLDRDVAAGDVVEIVHFVGGG